MLETALSISIEVRRLVLNTLNLDTQSRLVSSVLLWDILPYPFNSLPTKYFIDKETLSKSRSLFWRSYSTQTSDTVKFTALSQTVVYSCLSICSAFELLETAWINILPLLFATELRLHYWHCSRDEPRSVFSDVHHALPVLWLIPEAPGPSGLHARSVCSPWTAVLRFEACCWSTWPSSPTKLFHCPSKTGLYAYSSSKCSDTLQLLARRTEETKTW